VVPETARTSFALLRCAIMRGVDEADLAACLRSWRDRLDPVEVGLAAGRLRRAPGLRREELAMLAGLSVDYLARLEQGRASNPSPSVVAALARALRLSDAERDHLHRVAGLAPPGAGHMSRHLTPGVQRVLDRLADVPVVVVDPSWEIVAANGMAQALTGVDPTAPPRERNIAWRLFTGGGSRFDHSDQERAALEEEAVADLHEATGRYGEDPSLRALVADLRAASPRFAELWERRPVARRSGDRKSIVHPEVGRLTLDCDMLMVMGSDLRLIVYTAAPGSPDADALALLGAIGTQSFSGS
jgi:transcriptional regulator with XRE-family HTH domain